MCIEKIWLEKKVYLIGFIDFSISFFQLESFSHYNEFMSLFIKLALIYVLCFDIVMNTIHSTSKM
jgi:hypothetical protein